MADDPRLTAIEQLAELLKDTDVQIRFGLYQQGKLQRVVDGVKAGESWESIGKAIGWAPDAIKQMLHLDLIAERDALLASHARAVEGLDQQAEDARMGHVRLDETRAKNVQGPLYDRISWLIQLLTTEVAEHQAYAQANEAECRKLIAEAEAAKHRREAAIYKEGAELQELRVALSAKDQELELVRRKARDWNAEADKYLAGRDEMQVRAEQAEAESAAKDQELANLQAELEKR